MNKNAKIKVVLADDHQILIAGLRMTIGEWDEFEVVGTASDGKAAVELCDSLDADLVLMDIQMPVMSGTEAARLIKKDHPEIKIAALTTFDDAETVRSIMQAGFDGFLLKVIEPEQLKNSLLAIMSGINTFDAVAMKQLRESMKKRETLQFSEREQMLLQYICKGDTNKEIAQKMNLQAGTVKNMVSLLLSKTSCVSRADLTRYALEHHLVRE